MSYQKYQIYNRSNRQNLDIYYTSDYPVEKRKYFSLFIENVEQSSEKGKEIEITIYNEKKGYDAYVIPKKKETKETNYKFIESVNFVAR